MRRLEMAERRECCTCVNWVRDRDSGICRAHAPVPMPVALLSESMPISLVWPRTDPSEWCGEWDGKYLEISEAANEG